MSEDSTEPATVVRLVHDVQLLGIQQTELAARRGSGDAIENAQAEPVYGLNVKGGDGSNTFRVGLRTEIQLGDGSIVSEIEAEYALSTIPYASIEEQTKIDFANEVAIMAILPFTRQAIADITARVFGAALLMPIIQRGQLVFGLPDSREAEG
ncbi:hypothetical protein [uncultured Leifsonia sp.]|uniref:hypothetical protein n=1 Tax=uncultured Leifsonia sp. TaxID=340359 RepID=UPI0025F19F7F|nr:hypothetical protein [uncultured Leifsonia sp.]